MLRKFFRAILTIIGGLLGYGISLVATYLISAFKLDILDGLTSTELLLARAGFVIIFAFLFFLLAPLINRQSKKVAINIESELQSVSEKNLIAGTIGLVVGLFLAFLISEIYVMIGNSFLATGLSIITYLLLGYVGVIVATNKAPEIPNLFVRPKDAQVKVKSKGKNVEATPKIFDTSVIIDGRIIEIMKTGFVEGPIVIPEFVLLELQHIADSSDSLKRNRGRRGLDILKRIQDEYGVEIRDTSKEKGINDIPEVDIKLLKLAKNIGGKVLTNDYNLNKVGTIQGIGILNINELANTLKPAVLPGEEMKLFLIKEGKEEKQAVAYLDDGTMIVVENGKKHIGHTIDAVVTSVLQTSAGRMIFAKPMK